MGLFVLRSCVRPLAAVAAICCSCTLPLELSLCLSASSSFLTLPFALPGGVCVSTVFAFSARISLFTLSSPSPVAFFLARRSLSITSWFFFLTFFTFPPSLHLDSSACGVLSYSLHLVELALVWFITHTARAQKRRKRSLNPHFDTVTITTYNLHTYPLDSARPVLEFLLFSQHCFENT